MFSIFFEELLNKFVRHQEKFGRFRFVRVVYRYNHSEVLRTQLPLLFSPPPRPVWAPLSRYFRLADLCPTPVVLPCYSLIHSALSLVLSARLRFQTAFLTLVSQYLFHLGGDSCPIVAFFSLSLWQCCQVWLFPVSSAVIVWLSNSWSTRKTCVSRHLCRDHSLCKSLFVLLSFCTSTFESISVHLKIDSDKT